MADQLTKTTRQTAISTQDIISEWLQSERIRGQSEKTLETYRREIERYTGWLQSAGIDQPGSRDIAAYRDDLANRYSVQTVNLSLSAVRSLYRYMVEAGGIPYSPAADVRGRKRPKSRKHKRSELTSGEVLAVLDTCGGRTAGIRDRAIITLMAYCALRMVEIHRANVSDLKTEGDRMVLSVQGKGRTEADEIVIIPRDQEAIIRAWLAERRNYGSDPALFVSLSNRTQGKRLSTRAISDIVTGRYQLAGVTGSGKTTHSLRHSAITSAIRNGAAPMQVQAMARHASFDTTLGYIHEVNRLENPAEDLIRY
jgi:integrase/recombinase XerD